MTILNPPRYVQAGTYTAANDRLHGVTAMYQHSPLENSNLRARGGVLSYRFDGPYVINSSPSWSMTVGPVIYLVENDFAANGGDYVVVKTGNDVVTFTPSSPTTNRIDTVAIQVVDAFYSGSASEGRIVVVQGTATTGTPAPPTLPPSCEPIVDVSIPANSTAPVLSNDRRKRSGLAGSIIPITGIQYTDPGIFSGETQYYETLGTYRTWRAGSINEWRAFGGLLARNGAQLATSWTLNSGQEGNISQVVLNDPGGIWAALTSGQMEYSWSPTDARVDLSLSRNGINNGTLYANALPLVSNPSFPVSHCQLAGALTNVLTGTQTIYMNVFRTFGGSTTITGTPFGFRQGSVQLLLRAA